MERGHAIHAQPRLVEEDEDCGFALLGLSAGQVVARLNRATLQRRCDEKETEEVLCGTLAEAPRKSDRSPLLASPSSRARPTALDLHARSVCLASEISSCPGQLNERGALRRVFECRLVSTGCGGDSLRHSPRVPAAEGEDRWKR